jgi:hypothetical protein
LVVYDDPTYLTDHDHPKKAEDAGFVLRHSCPAGCRNTEIRTVLFLNSCMESETVEWMPVPNTPQCNLQNGTRWTRVDDGDEFLVPTRRNVSEGDTRCHCDRGFQDFTPASTTAGKFETHELGLLVPFSQSSLLKSGHC